ncbi:hypothetical protein, partial [Phytohabitans kaempferiae]
RGPYRGIGFEAEWLLPIQLPGNADPAEARGDQLAGTKDGSLVIEVEDRPLFVADGEPGEPIRTFIDRPSQVGATPRLVALPEVVSGVLRTFPNELGGVEDADSVWRLMEALEHRLNERLDPDKLEPGVPSQPLGDVLADLGFDLDPDTAGALIGPTPEGEPSKFHFHITVDAATESLLKVLDHVAENTWRDESTGLPVKERLRRGLRFGQGIAESALRRFTRSDDTAADRVRDAVHGFTGLLYAHADALATSYAEPHQLSKRHNAALARPAMLQFWAELPWWIRVQLALDVDSVFDAFTSEHLRASPDYEQRLRAAVDGPLGTGLVWDSDAPWHAVAASGRVSVREYFTAPLRGREVSQNNAFPGMTEWRQLRTVSGPGSPPVGGLEVRSYGSKWATVADGREFVERLAQISAESHVEASTHPVLLWDEPLPPIEVASTGTDEGTATLYRATELVARGDLAAAVRLITPGPALAPQLVGTWGAILTAIADVEKTMGPERRGFGEALQQFSAHLLTRWADAVVSAQTWPEAAGHWIDTRHLFGTGTGRSAVDELTRYLQFRREQPDTVTNTGRTAAVQELLRLAQAEVDQTALDFLTDPNPVDRVKSLTWVLDRAGLAGTTRLFLWSRGVSLTRSDNGLLGKVRGMGSRPTSNARSRWAAVVGQLATVRGPVAAKAMLGYATDLIMPIIDGWLVESSLTVAQSSGDAIRAYLTDDARLLLPEVAGRLAHQLDTGDFNGGPAASRAHAVIDLLAPGHGRQVAQVLTAPDAASQQVALRRLVAAVPPAQYEGLLPLLDSVDFGEDGKVELELVRGVAALAGGDPNRALRIVGDVVDLLDGPVRANWVGFLHQRVSARGIDASALSELLVDSSIDDLLTASSWKRSREAFDSLTEVLERADEVVRSRALDRLVEEGGRESDVGRVVATQGLLGLARVGLVYEGFDFLTEVDPVVRRGLLVSLLGDEDLVDPGLVVKLVRGIDLGGVERVDAALLGIVVDYAAGDESAVDDRLYGLLVEGSGGVTRDSPVLAALVASADEATSRAARRVVAEIEAYPRVVGVVDAPVVVVRRGP